MTRLSLVVVLSTGLVVIGCAHQPPPTTRPSYATTQPSYWLDQPSPAHVDAKNFDQLWEACKQTARDYGFFIDREDYRAGLITTLPLTSKQFFELWHNDVQTAEDVADSSIATYRRTLQFQFSRQADGSYEVTPSVLIERYAQAEQPITASVYLKNAFRTQTQKRHRMVGSREIDRGLMLPTRYWYATGRDTVLEIDIAKKIGEKLAHS